MAVFIGVDVAKEVHWACAIDSDANPLFSLAVPNEPEAIATLIGRIEALGAGRVLVALDMLGGVASLLAAMLAEAGIAVVHTPGLSVNRARQGARGGEIKSDPKDAAVIAELARTRRDLRPVEALAGDAVTAARAQRTVIPGSRLRTETVRELAREALAARDRLGAVDKAIEERLARHPDAALIRSLPGMGATLTAEFIALAGSIARFRSADGLAAAAGLAPVLRQSGKSRAIRRAHGGDKALKRVLYQAAFTSLGAPDSRAFYDRKRAEGKRHHQAVIALARRRVNVLWAVLQNRTPFQHDFKLSTCIAH